MFTFARLCIDHMNQGFIVGKKKKICTDYSWLRPKGTDLRQ